MGTRADFYVGRGPTAEWIGSITWDGYPDGIEKAVLSAASEWGFRTAVKAFFDSRDDVTLPADGWPWPWEDSRTTDYAYAFDDGRVWASDGRVWFVAAEGKPDGYFDDAPKVAVFPNMSNRACSGEEMLRRSGLMILGVEETTEPVALVGEPAKKHRRSVVISTGTGLSKGIRKTKGSPK